VGVTYNIIIKIRGGVKMTRIIWATPHQMTSEQLEELKQLFGEGVKIIGLADAIGMGVPDITASPDDPNKLRDLAVDFVNAVRRAGIDAVIQPAGSQAFQFMLGTVVKELNVPIVVAYAHSERVGVNELQEDGSVKKTSFFLHKRFILL